MVSNHPKVDKTKKGESD
jgi:serine/threonine protein kinase